MSSLRGYKTQKRSLMGELLAGILLLLPLLLLEVQTTRADAPRCCQSDVLDIRNNTSSCQDGSEIPLNCTWGFYVFRPAIEQETFVFLPDLGNRSWLIFEGSTAFNVSPDNYCSSKNQEGEEVMLICFPDQSNDQQHPVWRLLFYGLFSMLSSVFLGLTLLVYLVLPQLRELQDKAMMSMVLSFMIAFFLTGNQQLSISPLKDDFACISVAFTMYYAYMCAFFWLNIISLNIWRSVWFPSLKVPSDVLFIIYSGVGWGLPLCFLALSVISHHAQSYHFVKPGFGEISCWFNGNFATWTYFYGPVMVLLSANLIYLTLTGWKLWRQYKDMSCCKLKVLRLRCLMCFKLGLIMGFTWIFEVLSFAIGGSNQYYWILPDVLNALQGFLIFLILVACRKRVRKLLAQRKPFNIPFPKSWAAYADLEDCEPVGPEELELSQSS